MGIGRTALGRYELRHDLPISRTRYGRALMSTVDFRRWVLSKYSSGSWWDKGRRGRKDKGSPISGDSHNQEAEVPHSKE